MSRLPMAFFERKPPTARATHFDLATERGVVAISLRRHPRARNYTLRVGSPAGAPVLTMPVRGSLAEARAFLDRNAGWLINQMGRLPEARPIVDGATIPLRAVPHLIRHLPHRRGTVTPLASSEGPVLLVAGREEHLRRRVIDYLKKEARRDLERAVARHAMMLGVRVSAIRLRDQTSRWGSCSSTGTLSFSWRLVMAPPFVLDYLAAHEVAHLHEMNHGPRFWHLVESVCPETKQARAWLNRDGLHLHAIGAESPLAAAPTEDDLATA
ncbi:MAG: SprT family zinc-dependent metalloprotease [Bauldia litoralis]